MRPAKAYRPPHTAHRLWQHQFHKLTQNFASAGLETGLTIADQTRIGGIRRCIQWCSQPWSNNGERTGIRTCKQQLTAGFKKPARDCAGARSGWNNEGSRGGEPQQQDRDRPAPHRNLRSLRCCSSCGGGAPGCDDDCEAAEEDDAAAAEPPAAARDVAAAAWCNWRVAWCRRELRPCATGIAAAGCDACADACDAAPAPGCCDICDPSPAAAPEATACRRLNAAREVVAKLRRVFTSALPRLFI